MVVFLSVAASAFGIACLLTYLLARPGSRLQILDHPNERSLHSTPMPRTGGLAIWAGGLAGMVVALVLLGMRSELAWIAGAALAVGIISFIDDRYHVPVAVRLTAHWVAGGLLLVGGLGLQSIRLPGIELDLPTGAGLLLGILFVVWMTNLYNFMDGMDGFAAGMGLVGFGSFAFLGWWVGNAEFALVCIVIALATAGFLVFNFPPARIFMGDTGSSTLGLLAGAFSLWADRDGVFPLWVGALVFSPFIVDATVTLGRRLYRGDNVWAAHKTHYYQRLVQLGWSHRKTTLSGYALMSLCSLAAIVAIQTPPAVQWLVLASSGIVYLFLLIAIEIKVRSARIKT